MEGRPTPLVETLLTTPTVERSAKLRGFWFHSCTCLANTHHRHSRRQCKDVNNLETQETNEIHLFILRCWTLILDLQLFRPSPNAYFKMSTYPSYTAQWTPVYINFDPLVSSQVFSASSFAGYNWRWGRPRDETIGTRLTTDSLVLRVVRPIT